MDNLWLMAFGVIAVAGVIFLLIAGRGGNGGGKQAARPVSSSKPARNSGSQAESRDEPEDAPPSPDPFRPVYATSHEEAKYHDEEDDSTIGGDFYEEVAELLLQVLSQTPERHDLRLKLFDVYFDSGDKLNFVKQAQEYSDLLGNRKNAPESQWNKVLEMGKALVPEHALFGGEAKTVSASKTGQKKDGFSRFGDIPEARQPLEKLAGQYKALRSSASFLTHLDLELIRTLGRPSPMQHAARLSQKIGGAQIFMKCEDLPDRFPRLRAHLAGQAFIASRLGMKKILFAADNGYEAVIAAQSAAKAGLKSVIFLSADKGKYRQSHKLQVRLLGGEFIETLPGTVSGDLRNAPLQEWIKDPENSFMMLNLAAGPAPYPTIASDLQSVIGRESLRQVKGKMKGMPRAVFARGGDTPDAIGFVEPFLADKSVEIFLVTPENESGAGADQHGEDIYHSLYTHKQKESARTILENMEMPRVVREHALLRATQRIRYETANPDDAQSAIRNLARLEGTISPYETAHVLAYACQYAKKLKSQDAVIILMAEPMFKDLLGVTIGDIEVE